MGIAAPRRLCRTDIVMAAAGAATSTAAISAAIATPAAASAAGSKAPARRWHGPCEGRDWSWVALPEVTAALEWDIGNGAHVLTMTDTAVSITTDLTGKNGFSYQSRVVFFPNGDRPRREVKVFRDQNGPGFLF